MRARAHVSLLCAPRASTARRVRPVVTPPPLARRGRVDLSVRNAQPRESVREIASTVRSSSDSSTRAALASASSPGGNSWLGSANTVMPAACAARIPLCESSIAAHARRVDLHPPRGLEEDVGRGLPARDLLGGDPMVEVAREAAGLHHDLDHLEVRGRREPERPARRQPFDRLDGTGQQRQPLVIADEQPLDDLRVDLLRARDRPPARRACTPTTPARSSRASRGWPPPSRSHPTRPPARAWPPATPTPSRAGHRRGRR